MRKGVEFLRNKRGQVTIFIIIAVVIIAAAIAFFIFRSGTGTSTTASFNVNNPNAYLQSCLQDNLNQVINEVSLQGGSLVPTQYILYNGSEVSYLCYTSEDYKFCSIQQPFIPEYVQSQIEKGIANETNNCFSSMVQNYKNQGYTASLIPGNITVSLLPNKMYIAFSHMLTVKKTNTQTFKTFNIILNNNLYELTAIASSIINFESNYGDADPNTYMTIYPQIKVLRNVEGDSKIYVVSDRNTGDTFQFASRSGVIPPGATFTNVATN